MKNKVFLLLLLPLICNAQKTIVEKYELYNDSIYLPGTLTYPNLDMRIPLVIFVHGSGNPDRDGNQKGIGSTYYIKTLSDSLTAKGLAFYRYDKRSSIFENLPKSKGMTINDLVRDVEVAIDKFKGDNRFSSLHLIGHSQGSLIAMMAVNENIASYTSLAGLGDTVDKALIRQTSSQNKDVGLVVEHHIKELKETDTIREVNPFLLSLFAPSSQKFLKSWIKVRPTNIIKTLNIPVLIIQGDMDSQVGTNEAQMLKSAQQNAQLVIISKMNHLLKEVENPTENTASYTNPDFPLSSDLVRTVVEFVKNHG